MCISKTILLSTTIACIVSLQGCHAFVASSGGLNVPLLTGLQAEKNTNGESIDCDPITSRRGVIFGAMSVFGAAALSNPGTAAAKYSDYARREKDWQERQAKGEVNYKTARDLRAELREIAPMNTEGSKIFCPNGPSAAVSPLMENKCGDRMAIPSVYGRSQDVVGNSIPGFSTARAASEGKSSANTGDFPSYGFN